jgi:hypothetical protein
MTRETSHMRCLLKASLAVRKSRLKIIFCKGAQVWEYIISKNDSSGATGDTTDPE